MRSVLMKFAYADPPYLGCGKLYKDKHPNALDWDNLETHSKLIVRLCDEYRDGWAMSLHAPSLRKILAITPEDCRIGIYCKTFAQIRRGVGVQWFWEPVIWRGGRKETGSEHRRDWCAAFPRNAKKDGLIGGKPRDFSRWIFSLLGAVRGDTLDDLFPGTGAVSAAWAEWQGERFLPTLPLEVFST